MKSNPLFASESATADQKTQGRTRVKIAVFSIVAVHVAGLTALLLTQGCGPHPAPEPQAPAMETNLPSVAETNIPPAMTTNLPPYGEVPPPTPPTPPELPVAATKYVVQSGDSFYSIAKAHGLSQKAVEAANPGVVAKSLKPKQEINLPAPVPAGGVVNTPVADPNSPTLYTVKTGDTLSKLATHFGTTTKAIKSLNGLTTDQIKVSQKLKIPAKVAPAPAPEPPAVVPAMPEPTVAPATAH